MNILQLFGISAGIISGICYLPYLRDILRHKTKPERATWFIWTVLTAIAFFSQLAKGATNSLWMTGVQTICIGIIFLLSLRTGIGGLMRRDIIALVLAAIGLLLWYSTTNATYALLISIFVDCLGSYLTVVKAYEQPGTETVITWVLAGIAGIFGMLAVGRLNPILLAFPFYTVVVNASVLTAIYLGKQHAQ